MGLPRRLVVATKNPDKVREVRAVLAEAAPRVEVVEGLDWPDVAETGETLQENALIKARAAAAATGMPVVADDTGLEVDALGGAPGVHTARYAGPEGDYAANRHALLAALQGVTGRQARFRTVVALVVPGEAEVLAEGVLEGRITTTERGSGGFGYDSVFEVEGRTLAEMGEGEKNRISHRARALQALVVRVTPGG
ncbi:MAG: Nucleoside 5-triphosphatase RdgB (dHAPTP, dITP, XTP-specific) [Actinobacteria bacterium]|nr:Nucleoside 5-triphosphatase RdgB (dHAPTP, dITP, XTP-specific) [Actinomycetota bacterium]